VTKGINVKDTKEASPTNPLKSRANKIKSPTLGGRGNAPLTAAQLDPLSPFKHPVVTINNDGKQGRRGTF
jgi:hypothetical protein